ncbi:hypothetical protein DSO57_1031847 [Entomophthora muscae]|uniref:Uncharacterized protein n=1 Tax=Entomophthora muscae TaxID=34485 RepID=A0ACC2T0R1_9FUNG|nr:hypothetical protein DSO57_1031847 [Entomophthora muscae]
MIGVQYVVGVSIVLACIAVVIVIVLGLYNRQLINRVSIRIQAAIAVLDIIRHASQMNMHSTGDTCIVTALTITFVDLLYFALNISLAANFQINLIHKKTPPRRVELFYWSISIGFSTALSLVPLIFGLYGRNQRGTCQFNSQPGASVASGFLFFVARPITVLYCLSVPIIALIRLYMDKYPFEEIRLQLANTHSAKVVTFKERLRSIILRGTLCPLACFFSLIGTVLVETVHVTSNTRPQWLVSWSTYGKCSVGILNFIAFIFDPSIQYGLKTLVTRKRAAETQPDSCQLENGPREDFSTLFLGQSASKDANIPDVDQVLDAYIRRT